MKAETVQKYKEILNIKLLKLKESSNDILACSDVNCSNNKHRVDLDNLYNDLSTIMEEAAKESFGKVEIKSQNRKNIKNPKIRK